MKDMKTLTVGGETFKVVDADAVRTTPQTLTEDQKDQVRINLGLNNTITCPSFIKSIAHRGYSIEAPENTLPAYVLAHKKGFKYAECDVRVTKDGVLVLLHDETIDRTSNGSGKVVDMTYEELLQYDFGSWKSPKYAGTKIPTFEEFIRCCKALGIHPYIEVQNHSSMTDEHVTNCVYIVKKYGMLDNVTWVSFGARKLYVVRDTVPNASLGWIGYTSNMWAYEELKREGNDVFWNLDIGSITEADIQKAIDNNIPLEVWVANDNAKILSINPYVRAIASDVIVASDVIREAEAAGVSKRYFRVSSKLSRVEINNLSIVAAEGSGYSATLTGGDDLSVIITMGGVDVTSSVYADGAINIPNVTGNIHIVASASEVTDGWALVKEIGPEQLHLGALNTDYNADSGLFLASNTTRVSYPYTDIVAIGGETYKVEFDSEQSVQVAMQFHNQTQMNVFDRNGTGTWNNITGPGFLNSGEEGTAPTEHNGSPIVGLRLTFKKPGGGTMDGTEITGARIYKKLRDQYTVSTELDGVIINNDSTTIDGGSSYYATLTANTDIVAKVVMGGVDVTSFVYANGVIIIPAVTGDVVITAYSYDNWSLLKTITPDQLHIGGVNPNDTLSNGLYMTETNQRLCYPYWDIETAGGETYKVEFDSSVDMKVGLQFFNQWQLSSFNNHSTSNWNNLHDAGLKTNGEEYTPPTTTANGGNVVGLRVYFERVDGAQVYGNEITEVRVYKKEKWSLVKTITPDQLHLGRLGPNYNALGDGLYMSDHDSVRLSYPYGDIAAVGGATYKVEFDTAESIECNVRFHNQTMQTAFVNKKTGTWNDNYDTGVWSASGDETTAPTEINGSPTAGIRFTFHKTDNSAMDGTEITEVRVYEKIAE